MIYIYIHDIYIYTHAMYIYIYTHMLSGYDFSSQATLGNHRWHQVVWPQRTMSLASAGSALLRLGSLRWCMKQAVSKMDCLYGKITLKRMIWGHPYFRKPPNIHTYIHTYVHTYIHTYIHTYVYIYIHKIFVCALKFASFALHQFVLSFSRLDLSTFKILRGLRCDEINCGPAFIKAGKCVQVLTWSCHPWNFNAWHGITPWWNGFPLVIHRCS